MVRFTESDIAFIKTNFDNHEELFHADHVNDVLFPIDRLILTKGYKDGYEELNTFGLSARQVYERIYKNN